MESSLTVISSLKSTSMTSDVLPSNSSRVSSPDGFTFFFSHRLGKCVSNRHISGYCSWSVTFLDVAQEERSFRNIRQNSRPRRKVCMLGNVEVVTAVV